MMYSVLQIEHIQVPSLQTLGQNTLRGIVCVAAVHQLWRSTNTTPTFGTTTPTMAVIMGWFVFVAAVVIDDSNLKQDPGHISCIQADK